MPVRQIATDPCRRCPAAAFLLKVMLGLLVLTPAVTNAAACSATASAISFGSYDPLSPIPNDSSTNIFVLCIYSPPPTVEVVTYTISLSVGNGSYAARQMLKGASTINYNLYTSPSRDVSSIWGDGSGGSVVVSGTLPPLSASNFIRFTNRTIYGRIQAQQNIPVGTYSSNVIMTIAF